jgi:DNA (cytosine-5)-methyltransferase 1
MTRPRLLDCFSGAGGCARGFQRAGFYVVGVDINPQPRYAGDEFHQADALEVLRILVSGGTWQGYTLVDFAAVHASPPCPAYSLATHYHGTQANHPDLIAPTRELLQATGLPWVIENVERSPLRRDLVLCGEMFGLRLHRHRVFEIDGFFAMQPRHAGDAMGIDWMARGKELANAIPPAYCEHIGGYLMTAVRATEKAA